MQVLLSLLLLFAVNSASSQNTQTKISGKIQPYSSKQILQFYTYNLQKNSYSFKKNIAVDKQGHFSFNMSVTPNLYQLKMGEKSMTIINDGDQHIQLNIDFNNAQTPLKITGSEASNQLIAYFALVKQLQQKYLHPLEAAYKKAMKTNDKEAMKTVEKQHQQNLQKMVQTLADKIQSFGASLANYAIIQTLDFSRYLDFIAQLTQAFAAKRPHSKFTQQLQLRVAQARRVRIGAMAPDFTLNNIAGNKITLSALRNKNIVLLDFWASWCLPCRKENPALKKIYAKYKTVGLEIIGVSTDENAKSWKKAVKKDGLTWMQAISKGSDIQQVYGIKAVPSNVLISKNGEIIARNVKPEELEKILARKLKQ